MTDWLDPEQVAKWLETGDEDYPVSEGLAPLQAMEQFVRAQAKLQQDEQVHVGKPPDDCWFCREENMLQVARVIVEAMDGGDASAA